MKKLFFIFLLLIANYSLLITSSFSTDTLTLKFFPLAVGNVYKYNYSSSGGLNYFYKARIVKDTIINSKKYFVTSGNFPGLNGGLIRVDTATGNLYMRFNNGYCSYSPYEILIDSLRARKYDSAYVCDSGGKHYCVDTNVTTVLNMAVRKKAFNRYNVEGYTTYSYGYGIGLFVTFLYSMWGAGGDWLVGAYINGVLYGDTTLTEITNLNTGVPDKFSLYQNYPNPFNPTTKIKFDIPAKIVGQTFLSVYDITGREIQTLVNEKLNPGTYEVTFDGSSFASGVYFYQLRSGEFIVTKKLVLLK